ncbi:MAG: hypothetical protein ABIP20_17160 [Chthoniobacteraceae bacterium]
MKIFPSPLLLAANLKVRDAKANPDWSSLTGQFDQWTPPHSTP